MLTEGGTIYVFRGVHLVGLLAGFLGPNVEGLG